MTATSVDDYLAGFDGEVRERLDRVRAAIHSVLPDAEESRTVEVEVVRLDDEP